MKKLLKTCLALTFVFGGISALGTAKIEAANETGWQKAYKTYIQNYVKSDDFGYGDSYITLVDLDRDGTPELFAGRSYQTVNSVDIAYTFKNGKAKAIQQKGPGMGYAEGSTDFELGMSSLLKSTGNQGIVMFKHKKTGQIIIIGRDGSSSFVGGGSGDYTLSLSGTTLTTSELSTFSWEELDSPGQNTVYSYSIRGKQVTKATYDQNRSNYYSSLKGIASGIKMLNGTEITLASGDRQIDSKTLDRLLGIK